jgi:hypothetical protein
MVGSGKNPFLIFQVVIASQEINGKNLVGEDLGHGLPLTWTKEQISV